MGQTLRLGRGKGVREWDRDKGGRGMRGKARGERIVLRFQCCYWSIANVAGKEE